MAVTDAPRLARGLSVIGAVPLICFVALSLYKELPRLVVDDPCFVWGQTNTTQLSVGRPPCEYFMSGTSETKAGAVVRLTIIQGTILGATVLALVGSFKRRPVLCAVGFLMIAVVSVPLMLGGLGIATLVCASFFLPSCYWTRARIKPR